MQKRLVLLCEDSLCPRKQPDVSGPGLGEAGRYSYHHNVWAIQKEIKDAYPKKVCRHLKKKYSPYQKYYKGERIHIKEFHPPSSKNIHTLAHLDQVL